MNFIQLLVEKYAVQLNAKNYTIHIRNFQMEVTMLNVKSVEYEKSK